MLQYVSTITVK